MSDLFEDDTRDFRRRVVALVAQIPHGRFLSYGDVATLAGSPRAARVVASILRAHGDELPWHRVVNRTPAISPGGDPGRALMQLQRLQAEGLDLHADGRILSREAHWPLTEALDALEGAL